MNPPSLTGLVPAWQRWGSSHSGVSEVIDLRDDGPAVVDVETLMLDVLLLRVVKSEHGMGRVLVKNEGSREGKAPVGPQ